MWLGGGIFVAALACCVWWYLGPLGRELPPAGPWALAWNAALLALFAGHHSVFARDAVKRVLQRWFGGGVRSVYVWVASLLLIAVCMLWRPIGGTFYDAGGVGRVALAAIQLSGIALIAWSVARIDPLELAGIRETGDRSPRHDRRPVPALQIEGPYRIVRHPLYLGWMIAAFAAPHLTGDRLAFAVLTSIYLVVAVPWEERSLIGTFGDDYRRYAGRVRWRVIPFIY